MNHVLRPNLPSMRQLGILAMGLSGLLTGCAAFHPVDGIPVKGVPAVYRGESRSGKVAIPLSRLGQTRPAEYRVDSGDLLGIFVEGILGEPDQIPPVTIANNPESQPSLGYPMMVQDDGTISLPQFPDLYVRGMTLREIRERIRHAYTVENPVMGQVKENEAAHILVTLQRKRTYRVMVIRQESADANANTAGTGAPSQIDLNVIRRGSGQVVQLPAYENDVLHALTQTGGLPSSAAENAVYIIRRRPIVLETPNHNPQSTTPGMMLQPQPTPVAPRAPVMAPAPVVSPVGYSQPSSPLTSYRAGQPIPQPTAVAIPPHSGSPYGTYRGDAPTGRQTRPARKSKPKPKTQRRPGYTIRGQSPLGSTGFSADAFLGTAGIEDAEVIRIPLRAYPGEHPPFEPCDVILQEGDIVFVESRENEFFFTGGLLGGGQYVLPQNYDLDLLEALSIVQSQVNSSFNGATRAVGGVSSLNQDVTVGASKVIILRKTPDGREIRIKVDLYDAIRDPCERIIIQPGDYVLLQYTRAEAVAAFFERHILEGAVLGGASSLVFGGNN